MRSRASVTRVIPALVLVVASLVGRATAAGAVGPRIAVGTNVNVSRLLGNQAAEPIDVCGWRETPPAVGERRAGLTRKRRNDDAKAQTGQELGKRAEIPRGAAEAVEQYDGRPSGAALGR